MKSLNELQKQLDCAYSRNKRLQEELNAADQLITYLKHDIDTHPSSIIPGIISFMENVFGVKDGIRIEKVMPIVLNELKSIKAAGFEARNIGISAGYSHGLAMHETQFCYLTAGEEFVFKYTHADEGDYHDLTCLSHTELTEDVCEDLLRSGDLLNDMNEQIWNDDSEPNEDEVMMVLKSVANTQYLPIVLALGSYTDGVRFERFLNRKSDLNLDTEIGYL